METCEIRVIEDPERLRLLMDETRQSIVYSLGQGVMSMSQLARQLNKTPATIHYHMKKLERIGLVKLERTQIVNNNLVEKYYALAISPCIVGLGVSVRQKGPVPPKGYKGTRVNLKMLLEQVMSQFRMNYKGKEARRLVRDMGNMINEIISETDEMFREMLLQLNLRLSPYDQRRIQRIASAIPVLTFCQLMCNPERLATLANFIQQIYGGHARTSVRES